jgi:predicted RecA/RadA family phage recombinase
MSRLPFVPRLEICEDRTLLATGIGFYAPTTDTFSLRNLANAGPVNSTFQLSAPGSIGIVGDWNGDGKDDFGVFDSKTATWTLRYGAETGPANAGTFQFGRLGALPVVGDWNGDGRDDIGTFDPKTATWTLRYGASPGLANAGEFTFGQRASLPVVGDWDGDGKDGIGTFVSATGTWTLRQTATAGAANAGTFRYGTGGTRPVVGDWNNDGRDGIGIYQAQTNAWVLRQTATAGLPNAGMFRFGKAGAVPIVGDFVGKPAPANALATLVLKPLNLDLLGLEVRTSPITITVSAHQGNGQLLGNVLNTVSGLIDLQGASNALNTVLGSTVDLLNSVDLSVLGVGSGPLDTAPLSATQVLELFVAPVHLDLLGAVVDTSPIRVTITANSGPGLVLGNVVTELTNLFNPPLPDRLDIDFINSKLEQLLATLNQQIPDIAPAPVPPVPVSDGQILNITVPPLDLNLLGLVLQTSPITVNASAQTGDGLLVGNVLTLALNTLDATPENLATLNTDLNALLAKVVGVLNAADLSLPSSVVSALPPALQTLANPGLIAPAAGSSTPILDLVIASTDGTSPPVDVDLLGLTVTTSNIDAHLNAVTGEGQVLGNLLYNLANLANPDGPIGLLTLLNAIGSGNLGVTDLGGILSPSQPPAPEQLLQITLKPLNLDLLGLEVHTDPIIVTLSSQGGDGKLLGNLLTGIKTLVNLDGVGNALNNVLSTTVDLVNSIDLSVLGVGSGVLDNADEAITPVLDLFVAPVHLDLLGAVVDTNPIHLTITAHSGQGQVLGNVVTALANLFNPPLPDRLDIDFLNGKLATLLDQLNQQIPGISPAPSPPVTLGPGQFLELTVPPLDLNLLGLALQTSPITVNATAQTGNGLLLGNVLTVALNTLGATPSNLTGLNTNLNALLAKVVGVLNAARLNLSTDILGGLPSILQSLALPNLIATTPGASSDVLNLIISAGTTSSTPVDVNLLGLQVTTSDINAKLRAITGNGQILGNLVYNVANLLNPGNSSTLLMLLTQLSRLGL